MNLLIDIWYFSNFYLAKEWEKILDKQQLLHDTPLLDLVGTQQSKNFVQAETLYTQIFAIDNPLQEIPIYQIIVQLNPQKHEAWYNLGLLYENAFQDYEQAKTAYLQATVIKPDYQEAIGNLGWICFIQGQLAEAEQYFEKSVSLGDEHHKMNLGHIRLWQGRQQEALVLYAQSLESMENKDEFFAAMQDDFQYLAPHGVSTAVFEEIIAKLKS